MYVETVWADAQDDGDSMSPVIAKKNLPCIYFFFLFIYYNLMTHITYYLLHTYINR